jgi:hypothetical protein
VEAGTVIGPRKWIVAAIGITVALCGALVLPMRSTFLSRWIVGSGRNGVETSLLIDTGRGPLTQRGGSPLGSLPEGEGGPGYELRIRASSGGSELRVALLSPNGAVRWSANLGTHEHAALPPTTLDQVGVWIIEVSAPGRIRGVDLQGRWTGSPWPSTPSGFALPISWLAAGIAVAILAWRGSRESTRVAAYLVTALAVTWPWALATSAWIFRTTAGPGSLLAVTLLLPASAGIALGWTQRHPAAGPPARMEVVLATTGAILATTVFIAAHDDSLCTDPCPAPWVQEGGGSAPALMVAGMLLLGVGSWLIGRRTAVPAEGSVRRVLLDTVGTVFGSGAIAVLVLGTALAWITAYSVGLSDQGPDPVGGRFVMIATLVITGILTTFAFASFRFDTARRRRRRRSRYNDPRHGPRSGGQPRPSPSVGNARSPALPPPP